MYRHVQTLTNIDNCGEEVTSLAWRSQSLAFFNGNLFIETSEGSQVEILTSQMGTPALMPSLALIIMSSD